MATAHESIPPTMRTEYNNNMLGYMYIISRISAKSVIKIGARRKGMDGPDRRGYLSCLVVCIAYSIYYLPMYIIIT